MSARVVSAADDQVRRCLDEGRSFALVAGAGSGKTTSLVDALDHMRARKGALFRREGQRIACITYTKRAVEVIGKRLGFDSLFVVSTLHSFLWGELGRFHHDIRDALIKQRLPDRIAKAKEDDDGGKSQKARKARATVASLEAQLALLPDVATFTYDDNTYSNYGEGRLSHDDVVEVASYLFREREVFRHLVGVRYPVTFVDEAQDTFDGIVSGLNLTCAKPGLPMVGYFGDPWQQIYDGRASDFAPPATGEVITKTENFRCPVSVIKFLNAFRTDVAQYAAGCNKEIEGSVIFTLVQAEEPAAPRGRYDEEQVERALRKFDAALADWGWKDVDGVIQLFLVRQMIARRLGFPALNKLFTGDFASKRTEKAYEDGSHFLLKPIVEVVQPLLVAQDGGDSRKAIDLLRLSSPAFAIDGPNANKTLAAMIAHSREVLAELQRIWKSGTMRDVFSYCGDVGLLKLPERLVKHLARQPRTETYDEDQHATEKEDWLVDALMAMPPLETGPYATFISEHTPYSTQHGVKGEQYRNVLVVYDDIEAAWHNYNFTKLLTPATAGDPTAGQQERGRKLAYVCFSRATENLRVMLFLRDPEASARELFDRGLLQKDQIRILKT